MPSKKESPKMLESVLKAIADLKESQGSTVRNIINHIKSNPEKQTGRKKYDITSQVRRALTQGKNAGVIVHNAKKYRLTTTPSKCSNLLARSYAGKRRKKSRRRRKGRSRRKRRRRSESASVSEASDHPSEGSSAQGGDGAVTEAGRRRRRSKSRGQNSRRSRRRRQQEESCDDRTDDDDDVEENSRKRPRHSDSDKDNQQLYASQQQECDNPDCLCNIRHEADEKRDSDGEDPNSGTLLKY